MNHLPKTTRRCHPQETANFFSQLFFLYTTSFFRNGYDRNLENEVPHEVPLSLKCKKLADNFEKLWTKRKSTVLRVFLRTYGLCYFLLGLTQVIVKTSLIIVRPFLVESFASFFSPNQTDSTNSAAGLYGFSIVLLTIGTSWYDQWYIFKLMNLELQVRASMTALFYRKILKLSSFALESTSTGEVMTLITKDVNNIEICIRNANEIWTSIFQTFILFYVLFQRVGVLVLTTIVVVVLLPKQISLALKCAHMKEKILKETDSRLQTTNEALTSLKVVKMNGWEKFFTTKLHDIRLYNLTSIDNPNTLDIIFRNEIHLTHQIFFLKFIIYVNGFVWIFATFFVLLTMFIAFGKEISSDFVFFLLETYRSVGCLLTVVIPLALSDFAQAGPTLDRIDKFMGIKESPPILRSRGSKVVMKEVKVTIKKEQILHDINFEFNSGVVLVTGPVGGGKTVLLKTILGECELSKGTILVEGEVSYSSQTPWVFPGTLRQNIVFGEIFNERRYNQVVEACDLENDFQEFGHGDHTVGTNLSKSQRVRIDLARALYKDSDIYILDDPLASLDPLVRQHIISKSISKLLHNKLVILVTQHTNLFAKFQTVALDDGEVCVTKTILKELTPRSDPTDFEDDINEKSKLLPPEKSTHECRKTGPVSCSVYKWWWWCGGGFALFVTTTFLLFSIPVVTMLIEQSIFFWSGNEEKIAHTKMDVEILLNQRRNIIGIVIFLLLVQLVVTLSFGVAFLSFAKRASVTMYDIITNALFGADYHFFNLSIGNVLNKMSRDLLNTDEILLFLFCDLFKMVVPILSATILIVRVQIILLPPLTLLVFILMALRRIYVCVGRHFKRLEASSRTAVVEHFNSTLDGITTIKAHGSESRLLEEFETRLDSHISASFTYLCTTRAFCLVARWTSSIFVGVVISRLLVVGFNNDQSCTISLTLFQSLLVVEILNTALLKWAELENYMTSTERLLEVTETRQERRGVEFETWPISGQILFQNVSLTYDSLRRPVLKNLNFIVKPKEKIGVVGRNTAGKSSLISALMGVTKSTGRISISGVNTNILSLDGVRSVISAVSEEVVILKGTIRENLDPYNKFSNDDLWTALELVNLKKFVWGLDVNICDTYLVDNICYKQKLQLARVIVEKKRIVLLDDFLKNTDKDTENIVVKIIETTLRESTLLVVTQNLKILSCCDRIMVLDDSEMVQFNSPSILKNDRNGLFYKLLCSDNFSDKLE